MQQQRDDYFQYVRREIEPLVPRQVRSALEIGCGAGGTMRWLRSVRPIEYAAGVELFEEPAQRARTVFDDVEAGDIGAASLEFRVPAFDVILALDVLEHLVDPWTTLRRLRGLLSPDGVFIASIPNVAHIEVAGQLFLRGSWNYAEKGLLDRTHLRFFTRETIADLFQGSGYAVDAVVATRNYPNLLKWLGVPPAAGRWYTQKLLRALPLVPSRWFDFQYLVAARPASA